MRLPARGSILLLVGGARSIYLDNNASTPILPEVADLLSDLAHHPPANPSSPHSRGAEARRIVETSRAQLALALNCPSEQLYFVSSGSEANNMALWAALSALPNRSEIVVSTVEHSSILACAQALAGRGITVAEAAVGADGKVDVRRLGKLITSRTALVSIQFVNNETGVVQDVSAIRDICQARGALFHCDAAQAFGKMQVDVEQHRFDLASFTAHKINGPQGIGVLFAKSDTALRPVIAGGGQERHLRGGTENLLGIAAFGLAADIRRRSLSGSVRAMAGCRDLFERTVLKLVPAARINGSPSERVCNTTNLQFPGIDGRMLVARLDEKGICCSQSSACTTNDPRPSHVLTAMGLSENAAYESVRFSFGVQNTLDEASRAAEIVAGSYAELAQKLSLTGGGHRQ